MLVFRHAVKNVHLKMHQKLLRVLKTEQRRQLIALQHWDGPKQNGQLAGFWQRAVAQQLEHCRRSTVMLHRCLQSEPCHMKVWSKFLALVATMRPLSSLLKGCLALAA